MRIHTEKIKVKKKQIQRSGEARQEFLRLIRAQRFRPAPYSPSLLTTEKRIPGVVRVPIKGIVVRGELVPHAPVIIGRLGIPGAPLR